MPLLLRPEKCIGDAMQMLCTVELGTWIRIGLKICVDFAALINRSGLHLSMLKESGEKSALGGRLFESDFCDSHAGQAAICTRSVDCSVRSLWRAVQVAVDQVVGKATLRDLLQNEREMNSWVRTIPGPSALRVM